MSIQHSDINIYGNTTSGTITSGRHIISTTGADWATSGTIGLGLDSLHLYSSNTANYGSAITFGARDSNPASQANAGIYVRSGGGFGTTMALATSDNYSQGSKVSLFIDHAGNTSITRGNLTASGTITGTTLYVGGGTTYYTNNASSYLNSLNLAGNLGVGTTATDRLHVYSTATSGEVRIGGGNGAGAGRIYIQANTGTNNSYIDVYGDSVYKQLTINANPLILNNGTGNVGINTTSFTYTTTDNTSVINTISNNKLFINGSIQLLNDNDAIVFGRGTSSFFRDEEIGFGWGGGWYMVDSTYLRVRNGKTVYSTGDARFDGTIYVGGASYYISGGTSRLYDLTIENGSSDNTKINLKSSSTAGYSALRFNYAGAEQNTIHAFGSTWSSGFPLASQGAINLSPNNGVTFGAWNSPGAWIYNSGQAQFQNSVRSPIFYDSVDTAFYINANDRSILSSLQTGGSISTNTQIGATLFGVYTADGKYMTKGWAHADGAYQWPGTTYRNSLSDAPIGSTAIAGNGAWSGHRQAGWTPVDTTKTYKISVWIRTTSGNPYCYLSLTQAGYDLSQPTNGGWGNPYFWSGVPPTSWTEYTMTIGPSGAGYTFNSGVKFIQVGWLHNYLYSGYSGQAEISGFKIEELDNTLAYNTTVLGNIYANRYLDANDGNYYADPASTSNLRSIQLNTLSNAVGDSLYLYSTGAHQYPQIFSNGNLEAMWNYRNSSAQWYVGIRTSSQLVNTNGFHFYNTTSGQTVGGYDINGNHIVIAGSYATAFYDQNSTGYYANPAGQSRFGGGFDFDGGAGLRSVSGGTSYTNHIQIREASGYSGNTDINGAPSLGFHWGGVVASNITMEASGRISIRNNPGTGYENLIANNIYGYAYYGSSNVAGTGAASYHPSGIYSTGTNWLYGTMYLNVNSINDAADIRLYNSSYHFRARYTAGSDIYHASLNWYGLQLGNNGDNYIVAGRTNTGGKLSIYVNNTSDFTSINGTRSALFDSDGRLYSFIDTRSPIFYNYSDTGYYIDGESISRLAILRIPGSTSGYSLMVGYEQTSINGVTHVLNDNARYSVQINAPYYPHLGLGSTNNSGNVTHGAVLSLQGYLTGGGYRRFGMGIANQNPSEMSFGWYDNQDNPHYGVGINWSYPATMWYDTSHNFYVRSGMYSYAWYDRDNTAYRIDATSSSRLSSLTVDNAISAPGVLGYARRVDNVSREQFTVGGNASTYYPVSFYIGAGATSQEYGEFVIERGGYDDPGYSGIGFSTLNARFSVKASGWGFGATYEQCEGYYSTFNAIADWQQFGEASYFIIWLRGATTYFLWNVVGSTSVQFANSSGGNYDKYYGSTYFGTLTPTTSISDKASYSKQYVGSLRVDGTIKTPGTMYAAEFRDADNTGYYQNPAGDSRMNTLTPNRYYWYGVGGDSGQGGDYYSMYQEAGGWTYPYPDLIIANHTGIKIGGYYGYNGTRFYNNSPHAGSLIASIGDGDNNLRGYADIIAYASDRRLKENFRPLENAITRVQSLNGYLFDWKDNVKELGFEPNKKTEVGVIAQDVEAVLPEAVAIAPFDYDWKAENGSKSGERYLTVKYEKIVPLLIEAIKEQQTQIDELKETINNLQK